MKSITVVIHCNAAGAGVTVETNTGPPRVGEPLNAAEALVMDFLRDCKARSADIRYGRPEATLCGELLQAQHAADPSTQPAHHSV
ncbi:hypothetical protein PMI15_00883 [Polaromonas sp. CF318]|uniref:hypothetical protein n=1 Tax=Polaromonas sp. CF318 TaxID=1144318 RepID=UPI0002711751|nr:hypothetical protein [Polaromonas sp. CF318]EJL87724.1 hypothetical protein PMI15_00883 [Polaromonas sp. CF318]